MKIINITAENILGLQYVNIDTPTPITLIAGPNGAGKSSLQNAIRMAMRSGEARGMETTGAVVVLGWPVHLL